jgi:uroporphyrinogen-III decarboxylase
MFAVAMSNRQRFQETMHYGRPDRLPYFEEGIREEVVEVWRQQGLAADADLASLFPSDPVEHIEPDFDPRPEFEHWPDSRAELVELEKRLDPADPARLPENWSEQVQALKHRDTVRMLDVHQGLFLSAGIMGWGRFAEVMRALIEDPGYVHELMAIYGAFTAALAERILSEVSIDAAVFSEPIGDNGGPLISPKMYEEFVLSSYEPLLQVLERHGVDTLVFITYANARILIPSILERGFNCLWACEVFIDAMDYRDIRREFGRKLRLIGGIDLDALRQGKDAIREEIEAKVPPLVASGGYVPLADGRVREDVAFEDYAYYREMLRNILGG